jgi:hypothetical protein
MQRIGIEERIQAVLVEEHEADQHQSAGKQVRNIEDKALVHRQKLLVTNRRSAARRPSIRLAPMKVGTRKTRIFAIDVSKTASSAPPTASFTRKASRPAAIACYRLFRSPLVKQEGLQI